MSTLTHICHIYNPVCADVFNAVAHRGEISGRVVESTVTFSTNKWRAILFLEYAERAVVRDSNFLFDKLIKHIRNHTVVEALAPFLNFYVQKPVNFLKLLTADFANVLPFSSHLFVTRL